MANTVNLATEPAAALPISMEGGIAARWLTRRRVLAYARISLAVFAIAWLAWVATGNGLTDRNAKPVGGDFIAFYAASSMVRDGDGDAIYDVERLHEAERRTLQRDTEPVAWLYPPAFLLAVAAFSAVPYLVALGVWLASTLGLLTLALRRYWQDRSVLWLSLAFPGVMQNLIQGQTGFLSAGLLSLGLLGLPGRPTLAGACLGLITYKPHLAPVVFLALLASRNRRALAGAVASAGLLALVSLAAFGPDTWQAFVDNFDLTRRLLFDGLLPLEKLTTVSGALLLTGMPIVAVYVAQAAASIAAAAVVAWVWRREDASAALRNAALCLGVLLATPYAFDYDLVILGLALLWLGVECQRTGWRTWEREAMVVAWLSPLLAPAIAAACGVSLEPLVLAGVLWLVVRRSAEYRVQSA